MCSRMVSDTANRLLKRTDSEGSSSVAEKKSSAVPLFEAVAGLWSAPDSLRERGDSQEGGNRRCLPSCESPLSYEGTAKFAELRL